MWLQFSITSNWVSLWPWRDFVWWQFVLLMWNTTALTNAHFPWLIFSHLCFERHLRRNRNQVQVFSSCDYFRIIGVLWSCTKIELRHEQIWFFFFSPCVMLMQWSGPKLHEPRLFMFVCIGIAFQSVPMHGTSVTFLLGLVSSVTFFLFFRLRWILYA